MNSSMRLKFIFLGLIALLVACSSPKDKEFPKSFSVTVENTLDSKRDQTIVYIPLVDIKTKYADFNTEAFVVYDQENEVPSQFGKNDMGQEGVMFVVDKLTAKESKKITVRYNSEGENKHEYPKLTQAELSYKVGGEWKEREYIGGEFKNVDFLRVPPEHKDHSWYVRYEGPGWESDKVGYRFYLDQRNATDVFGKKVSEPVLQNVGLDGFDSYHEPSDWGMDVMKVGKSLGVGSIGMLVDSIADRVEKTDSVTSQIVENGVLFSSIETNYYGWKTNADTLDVESILSIHAGTRLTHEVLKLTGDSDKLCTGLVKDEKGKLFTKASTANDYGYIATYGQQSLNTDNLGIAVLFSANNFIDFTEDEFSHIVKLKSSAGLLDYYFLAAWEGETDGIKTEVDFLAYLDRVVKELSNPVSVTIN